DRGRRPWSGAGTGGVAARVRQVLQGRHGPQPVRGQWPRSGHRLGEREAARRLARRGQPSAGRRGVHAAPATARRRPVIRLLIACLLLLTGCGIQPSAAIPGGPAPLIKVDGTTLYFVYKGKLAPVIRKDKYQPASDDAIRLLASGPAPTESG